MSKSAKSRSGKTKAAALAVTPSSTGRNTPESPQAKTVGIPTGSKQAAGGSKQSRVIAMLQSPSGATIATMMKTTGWQQHSVRGFLARVVRKRLKLKLGSKKVDGERVYQVASGDNRKSAPSQSKRRSR
jgi:Protein of unknown function (DUF3489)